LASLTGTRDLRSHGWAPKKGAALPFDVSPFRVLMYEKTIDGKHQIEDGLRSHLTAIFAENQSL